MRNSAGRGNRASRSLAVLLAALAVVCGLPACSGGDGGSPTTGPSSGTSSLSYGITGATYYLSASGDDHADGRTPAHAWRSLSRANTVALRPGDGLLLRGGDVFDGNLVLGAEDGGDPTHPVIISSYEKGPAQLSAAAGAGVYIDNTAGVQLRNLRLVGLAQSPQSDGIAAYNALPAGQRLSGLTIEDVDVSGFADGIGIGGVNPGSGFADVTVRNSVVHDNFLNGMQLYGAPYDPSSIAYANLNVLVTGVQAYGNEGDPQDLSRNTGSGIIIGSTQSARVTLSVAHDNGHDANAGAGPNGIWAYDSTSVILEHDIAYANHTGTGTADGNGFEFDINVSSSTMQSNLSYGNDGAGFFLFAAQLDAAAFGNVIRYNVSADDVRQRQFYAGIMVAAPPRSGAPGSGISAVRIYNNTVVISATDAQPAAIRLYGMLDDVVIANNLLVARGGSPVLLSADQTSATVQFAGNAYFDPGRSAQFQWNGADYTGLDAWRQASGEEIRASAATGFEANPQVADLFATPSVTRPPDLPGVGGLIPAPGSPLRSGGVDLLAAFGIDRGPATYYGSGHPCAGPGVGASC